LLIIGHIDYTNMIPFDIQIDGQKERLKKIKGHPSDINQMLLSGKVDVGIISTAFYLENRDVLTRISCFGIVADGAAMSVLLFSNKDLNRLTTGKKIKLFETPHSKTSVAMNRIILSEFLKIGFEIEPDRQKAEAYLLIGDEALVEREKNEKFVYDIGTLWKKHTGLPAVFGVLATRKEFLKDNEGEVKEFIELLDLSYRKNTSSLEKMALKGSLKTGLRLEIMKTYFEHLKHEIGEKEEKSIDLLEKLMLKNGLLKKR